MVDKIGAHQLSFFSDEDSPSRDEAQAQSEQPPLQLSPRSPLIRAIGAFEPYMAARGFTDNTQQAFRLDMEILSDYLGPDKTLGDISTGSLNAFLKWMESGRGIPCSPKTLERRITTLKVFFGWLSEEGYLPRDVSAPLIHRTVSAPLPDVLTEAEVEAILETTESYYRGAEGKEPDARPHLLFTLVLHTGIKKGECVSIHLNHLDLADANHPAVWIRYKDVRRRHKERRISLPPWWVGVLDAYRSQYQPEEMLFPWSARNLEYVLTGVAEESNVSRLSFEMIRWTSALRDFQDEMELERLRRKMGLSQISWYEVEDKLNRLAQRRALQR
jgi:site-specific recombinase XerD